MEMTRDNSKEDKCDKLGTGRLGNCIDNGIVWVYHTR